MSTIQPDPAQQPVVVNITQPAVAPLEPKSAGVALGLTLLGFVLVAGIQHFYLGKVGRGILWLLTGGLFFVGTIVDCFTIGQQTKSVNARRAVGIK